MASPWDNLEVVAELDRLFTTTRKSAKDIAYALNDMFRLNLSRNAVVGRLNRKEMRKLRPDKNVGGSKPGVPKKSSPDGKTWSARRQAVRSLPAAFKAVPHMPQTAPRLNEYSASAPSEYNVDIVELTDATCRWPMGGMLDHPPYRYCGSSVEEGTPYCVHHAMLAYVAPISRRG